MIAVFFEVKVQQIFEVLEIVDILARGSSTSLKRLIASPSEEFVLKLLLKGLEGALKSLNCLLGLTVYSPELCLLIAWQRLKVRALS